MLENVFLKKKTEEKMYIKRPKNRSVRLNLIISKYISIWISEYQTEEKFT